MIKVKSGILRQIETTPFEIVYLPNLKHHLLGYT